MCSNCTYDAPSRNVCSAVRAMFRPTRWRRTLRVASRLSSSNAYLCLCVERCLAMSFRAACRCSGTRKTSWPSPARYFKHTGQYTSRPSPSVSRYARHESLTISGTVWWSIHRSRDTPVPCSARCCCCCCCCLITSSATICANGITCAVQFALITVSKCCVKVLQN